MNVLGVDLRQDESKWIITSFLFQTNHSVWTAFDELQKVYPTITWHEVENAFTALRLEKIPDPVNNRRGF
ncbi:hypothetical protein L3Y34_011272 [Caenorhabditis briggsae]|uniref:Uncharacterized protein n=1 Tax=Caenorhabditis briggsae TaxID=6238 RepID=A0AAE8ZNI9_CAEBR|nr:hypothetical protein L3Y34_011272 [Caenorhabditis briggsae]